jgi:4'-phosphopantetheinyl transferase
MAACAIGVGCDVGVDVESHDHTADDAIAELALSAGERQELAELPDTDRSKRLLALWTLKEAYLKATGEGIGGPLDRVAFTIDREGLPRLVLQPPDAVWRFALFAPAAGYTAAAACRCSGSDADRSIDLQPLL